MNKLKIRKIAIVISIIIATKAGLWAQVTPTSCTITADPYISAAEFTTGITVTVNFPSDPLAGTVFLYTNGTQVLNLPVIATQLSYDFNVNETIYPLAPDGTYTITSRHSNGTLSPPSPDLPIYLDRTPPAINAAGIKSNRGIETIAQAGDTVIITITANEAIYALDIGEASQALAGIPGTTISVSYVATGLPGGDIVFAGTLSDQAGNEISFDNTDITDSSYVCYTRTMIWDGSESNDWDDPDNWTWSGNPSSQLLSETDNVEITSTGNPATLSSTRTVNNCTISSGTLTLNETLTVNGTFTNNSIVEISDTGSINKSDNTDGLFRYTTGTGNIPALDGYKDLEISAGTWTAAGELVIGGDFTVAGTFNSGTHNLTVTGTLTNNGTVRLNGAETITAGTTSNGATSTVIYEVAGTANPTWGNAYRNLTIVGTGTTLQVGTQIISVAGTLENAGTVEINDTGTIDKSDNDSGRFLYSAAITANLPALGGYNDLEISAGTWTAAGDLVFGGNFTVAGTFDSDAHNLAVTGTLTNNGTVRLNGAETITAGSTANGVGSTVIYQGGSTANPTWGNAYQNLTIVGTGTTLQVGANTLTVGGSLENAGTVEINGTGTINKSDNNSGRFLYSAAAGGTLPALGGYNDLEISAGTWTAAGELVIGGDFTVAGTFNSGTHNLTVTGTLTNNGTVRLNGAETITAGTTSNGAGSTVIYEVTGTANPTWGGSYRNLTIAGAGTTLQVGTQIISVVGTLENAGTVEINNTGTIDASDNNSGRFLYSAAITANLPALGGYNDLEISAGTWTAAGELVIGGDFTVAGTFDSGAHNLTVTGTLTNNGTVRLNGAETITAGSTANGVGSTVIYQGGSTANPTWGNAYQNLTIVGTGTTLQVGANTLTVGGSLENEGTVEINDTGTIDASDNNSGRFLYSAAAGGTIPALDGYNNLEISAGTWTAGGDLVFGGNFTVDGTFDSDAHNLAVTGTLTNNGTVRLNGAETITAGSTANGVGSTVIYQGGSTANPTWGNAYQNLTIVGTGTTLQVGANTLTVGGSLENEGTVEINDTGTIDKSDNDSGRFLYSAAITANLPALGGYNDLEISAGTWTAAGDLVFGGNFTVDGTFDSDAHNLAVTGTLTNNGTVRLNGAETITAGSTANGVGSTVIYQGGSTANPTWGNAYQNLTIVGTGTTLQVGANTLTVGGSLENEGTVEINDTGTIDKSDNDSGRFLYSAAITANLPALGGYNDLEISAGTWTANVEISAAGLLTVSGAASASFNAGAVTQATSANTVLFTTTGTVRLGNDIGDSFSVTTGALAFSGTPTYVLAGTLTAGGAISLGKDFSLAAGTSFSSSASFSAPVQVSNGANTLTLSQTFDLSGHNLTLLDTGQLTNNSTIAVGNAVLTAPAIGGAGTVAIGDGGSIAAEGTIPTLNVSAATDAISINGKDGLTITGAIQGNLTTSGTVTLNGALGTLANSGTLTLNGNLNVTGNISNTGSMTIADGQALVQGVTADFTVSGSGSVSVGTGACTIGNLTVSDTASFTQTGVNIEAQSATSLTTADTGAISWDSGSLGGTLSLAGNIVASGGAITFGHKNVTLTAIATITNGTFYSLTVAAPATVQGEGVFYDLIVESSATFEETGAVRIQRNLTIFDDGFFTHSGNTLTFGGDGSVAGGTITDSNAAGSKQNLGNVIVDSAAQTKNAGGGGILMESMEITAGTFAAGANTIDITGDLTGAGTFTGGGSAINIGGNVSVTTFTGGAGAIDINGAVTGENFTAASATTTTVGGDFTPVTFTANGGTMIFDTADGSTIAAGTFTYNNVRIEANKTTDGGTLDINGTLTVVSVGTELDLATNNSPIMVTSTTTNGGIITGGTALMTFTGNVTNTGIITGGTGTPTLMTFTGNVTNNGGTVNVGEAGAIFGGNFSNGTLNGNGVTNPTIYFRGTTTTIATAGIAGDTIVFDGTGNQAFTPGAGNTYAAVTVNKTAGTFTVGTNALTCDSLTVTNSRGSTFNTAVTAQNLTLTATTGTIEFNSDLSVTGTFSNPAGNLDVNLYGTTTGITPGATFETTGAVRLGNGGVDTLTFGGGFTHTAGPTAINGNLVTTNDDVAIAALALGGTSSINTATGTGNIIISGAVTNVAAQSLTLAAGAGNILTSATLGTDLLNLASLTTTSTGTTTLTNRVYVTGAVNITGNIVNIGAATPGTGGINAGGLVTISHTGLLTIHDRTGEADITTFDIVAAGGFSESGGGAVSLSGDISTTATLVSFAAAPELFGHVAISTAGGNIEFTDAVTGDGTARNLILTAGTGNVVAPGSIGTNAAPLGTVQIVSATNLAGDDTGASSTGAIYAGNFLQSAGTGTTRLGLITAGTTVAITTANVVLTDTVTAPTGFTSAGTTFDNTNGTITTTGTLLRINHTGAITVGAALSSGIGNIDIDSGTTIGIGATVTTTTGAITIDATGLTTVTAAISASDAGSVAFGETLAGTLALGVGPETLGGNITFNQAVALTAPITVTTGAIGAGDISFGAASSITGAQTLKLTAGTGVVELASTAINIQSLEVTSANSATFQDTITTTAAGGINIKADTINLDGPTMTAAGASIDLDGAVTLSGGPVELTASENITVTGTVSGAQPLTLETDAGAGSVIIFNSAVGNPISLGTITITNGRAVTFSGTVSAASLTQLAGDGTTTFEDDVTTSGANGIVITATTIKLDGPTMTAAGASIDLDGAVTLSGGPVELTASENITVTGTVSGAQDLTLETDDGPDNYCIFTGTIGSPNPLTALTALTVTKTYNLTFQNAINVAGDVSITNTGLLTTAEGADFTLTGTGTFKQEGTGNCLLAGGVTTDGGAIIFTGETYLYGTSGDMTFSRNASTTDEVVFSNNLHIACPGKTVFFRSPIVAQNIVLYAGEIDFGDATLRAGLTAIQDIVLLNGDPTTGVPTSMYDDLLITGVENLFAYDHDARGTLTADPNITLATAFPGAPPIFPTAYSGTINSTNLAGKTFKTGGNFYANGVDLNPGTDWTLSIPDNDNAMDSFAEIYNLTIAHCTVVVNTAAPKTFARLAAADAIDGGDNNSFCVFNRPTFQIDDQLKPTGAAESGTYTVFDNVIRVEFVDTAGNPVKIENTNDEISEAVAKIQFLSEGNLTPFDGSFTNPECTISTDTKGDLSVFYLRTDPGVATQRWNTDATGLNAGASGSTDRGRPSVLSAHRSSVPQIDIPAALATVYQTLRDENKNRIVHLTDATTTPAAFTATTDRCRPVLVEVRTGQETHASVQINQRPYDAHNFIEFRWSEPVDIGDPALGFAGGVEQATYGIKYKKASVSFNDTTVFGGAITKSGTGLLVAGYASFGEGILTTGSRGSYAIPAPNDTDPTVHALYRSFSLDGTAPVGDQSHHLRIAVAGWCEETQINDGTDWKWFWQGYINSATTPSGAVTVPSNIYIRDRATTPNSIEPTTYVAATESATGTNGYGDFTHPNLAKANIYITDNTAPANLYSLWDTTPPAFAGLKSVNDSWVGKPNEYEAIPIASVAGLVSRLEMHFFDNAVQYSPADAWHWQSRTGWYQSTPANIIHPAPETFGGVRPETAADQTTAGGVRDASFWRAESAFQIRNQTDVATGGQLNGFVTTVNSIFYNLTASHAFFDDPYITVRIDESKVSWPIASAELEVSYTPYTTSSSDGGFVTDLAGNRLKSTEGFLRTLDRSPPRVTLSLAGVDRNDLFLLFSKNIMTGQDAEDGIRLELHSPNGSSLTLRPTEVVPGATSDRVLQFTLPSAITADQLVHPNSLIHFENYGTAPNPETGIQEPVSAYSDLLGNYVSIAETHRITDIAIGLVEVLYASDGVNTDGVFGTDEGALRVFDGTGRLLDRTITVGTRLANETSAPLALTMFFDAAPPATTLPNRFTGSTGISLPLWLPTILPGFNERGNTAARRLGTDQILDSARLFRNFVIPEADEEVVPGSRIEMLFRYGDLYCARLTNPNDITSIAPWSFNISETKRQRGGVTILNNVIDSNRRERTIIQVEVAKAGNIVVQVFTLDGNLVKVLERGRKGAGTYSYYWDGTNAGGRSVARGMYFIRVVGPDMDEIRKVMVVKE